MSPKRNSKYLAFVRTLRCKCCDAPAPSEAAHSNLLIHGKGKGIKACDYSAFPLCHKCHVEFDQGKSYSKEDREYYSMRWSFETIRDFVIEKEDK